MDRAMKLVTLLCCIVLGLAACTSGEQGAQQPKTETNNTTAPSETTKKSAPQEQGGETTQAPTTTTQPPANTGKITGRVTDEATGEPVSDTYILVGWQDSQPQLAAITDADGRYTVPNVPAGEPAPVLGFHEGNYRYNNSSFHDKLKIMLKPGETFNYDFAVRQIEPEGQPEVSDPSISSKTAAPGERVTFGLTARGGEGGLSPE
ncbi:MAG: carboxypeptidase-like regulatory domain-containing protein, partial [Actinobacteria bacterium]|nr:carboxypeptidase-like regulatory domain-containing protein [Actinomycetota bacterium]